MEKYVRRWILVNLYAFLIGLIVPPTVPEVSTVTTTENWSKAAFAGGNVRSLVIDPNTPTTLYAAAGQSVFRTTNGGGSWSSVLTSSNDISSVVLDATTNPMVLYASSNRKVWRSNDAGTNWFEISFGLDAEVQVLEISPTTHQLWAGTNNGVWRYTTSWELTTGGPVKVFALAFGPTTIYAGTEAGLFQSFDNAASWNYTPTSIPSKPTDQSNNVRSIAINPNNDQVVVVGTWFGGIYLSGDGGTTWERKTSGANDNDISFLDITDLVYVQSEIPNAPPILYASSESGAADSQIPDDGLFPRSGVFRLIDNNAIWEQVSTGLANRYVSSLAAHPTLPGTLYAGTLGSGIWLKTGTTSDWVSQSIGLTALSVKSFVRTGNDIYAATRGDGVHRSSDNGVTWVRLGQGLPALQTNVESLLIDDRGEVWMGHSRYGLFRLVGDTWTEVNRTVFGYTNVLALTSTGSTIIAAYKRNDSSRYTIVLSENRGANWQEIVNGLPSNIAVYQFANQLTASGIVVWAATESGLYRLVPGAASWEIVGASAGMSLTNVRAVRVDPNNANILYAVGNSVYKSLNGGTSWSARTDGLRGSVSDIAIDQTNTQYVYIVGSSGVQRLNPTTGSWTVLGTDGPNVGQSLIITSSGVVYVGSSNGIWRFVPTGSTPPIERPRTVWGILIYLNGDNDLDGEMISVFDRLEKAANNPAVCINVLWDRLNGPTREYLVQSDTTTGSPASTYTLNQNYWDYGELDMGARATFEAYIPRARVRCPADHYMVSVVDHGGGWAPQVLPDLATQGRYRIGSGGGLSWDDTSGGHRMGTRDIQLALQNATVGSNQIDVLFYDACLMGMFEDVYAARGSAQFLIASPNIAWGVFPYTDYVNSITATTTPRALAGQIVSIYSKSLLSESYTMAAYDLTRADAAANALKTLSQALAAQLPANSAKVADAFAKVQKYDSNNDDVLTTLDTSVDVVDLASWLAVNFTGTPVETAANALKDVVSTGSNPLIVRSTSQSSLPGDKSEYNLAQAHGLGIYFPIGTRDQRRYPVYIEPNGQIELANTTGWGQTISSLRNALPALAPEPDIDPVRYSPLLFQRLLYLPLVTQ